MKLLQRPAPPAEPTPEVADTAREAIRISDLVAPRRIPPGSGARRLIYTASGHTLNLGESRAERHYRELRERIRRNIRRQYVIAVVAGKGGVGKTTVTACLGAVFRECRPDNVVAVDAVPGLGTLAGRIDENPPGDYAAVLADAEVFGYSDIREHLGQNAIGLDVLAGDQTAEQPRPLDPETFDGVLCRLRRTHTVIVVDTGDDLEHPVTAAALAACDSLVFVSGLTADTALPVTRAVELLRALGHHDRVAHATVILNDSRDRYRRDTREHLTERFARCGANVEFLPYDPHLAGGGIIDVRDELRRATRLRLFEITAAIADKYVPDADRRD